MRTCHSLVVFLKYANRKFKCDDVTKAGTLMILRVKKQMLGRRVWVRVRVRVSVRVRARFRVRVRIRVHVSVRVGVT